MGEHNTPSFLRYLEDIIYDSDEHFGEELDEQKSQILNNKVE